MKSREVRRRRSRAVSSQLRDLSVVLATLDLAGLTAAGAPPGEYDCLAPQILSRLQRGTNPDALSKFLADLLQSHFEEPLAPQAAAAAARRLLAWYPE